MKSVIIVLLWVPTVILWVLFVLGFKLLGRLNGTGMQWHWLKIHAYDTYLGDE